MKTTSNDGFVTFKAFNFFPSAFFWSFFFLFLHRVCYFLLGSHIKSFFLHFVRRPQPSRSEVMENKGDRKNRSSKTRLFGGGREGGGAV